MQFKIEQIAIYPLQPAAAKALLTAMGAGEWAEDHVCASGRVFDAATANEANLSFNYDLIEGKEFEVLEYTEGANWMENAPFSVSHLGQHCTAEELVEWKLFFAQRGIPIAQEVFTTSHTNPVIRGKRFYHYVIFATRPILGVDIKFIVRRESPNA